MALPFPPRLDLPEQAMGWLPLGLGLVAEDKPSEFSCISACSWDMYIHWQSYFGVSLP